MTPRRPEPTGAIELDMEQLLSSGVLQVYRQPGRLRRLWRALQRRLGGARA